MPQVNKYPSNWKKVSKTIRRIAGNRCERCGSQKRLTVHHVGIGYVNGLPSDKHDVRRENLQCLCVVCHDEIDHMLSISRDIKKKARRRRERLEHHRSLGIGTGLMCI